MTQDEALTILKTGANVFLTGEPGSGKTHTINRYVAYLRQCGVEPAITASTGIAATHIDGYTIHSWSGIGVTSNITEYELDAIAQKEKVVRRVRLASVLIVDEISMLSKDTLASVELVCRTLRGGGRPFGGLQVVLVGDFFQLPPVVKQVPARQDGGQRNLEIEYEEGPDSIFAFRAPAWKRANFLVCYLTEQHRQEDKVFLAALGAVRSGRADGEVKALLLGRNVMPSSGSVHTKLFPHNANVDRINEQELALLAGNAKTFEMRGRGAGPLVEALKRNCLSPELLALKVGAKVMFTKNDLDGEYYNGTTGEVVGFATPGGLPQVKLRNGRTLMVDTVEWKIQDGNRALASIEQIPLRLAWAITVHKSQGMSLDSAVVDLSQAFEYGQGYVALSRVRTLAGLYLLGFNERALQVHPEVAAQDEVFRDASEDALESFGKMSPTELVLMHNNFIKASGGKVAKNV